MTHQKPSSGKQASRNLYEALDNASTLSCSHVQALLDDLVAAEHAEVDVDSDPRYSLVLAHLDNCDQCMEIYQELSDAMELFDSDQLSASNAPASRAPTFFDPPTQLPSYLLRLIEQNPHHVSVQLPINRPIQWVGALGPKNQEATLINQELSELPEHPQFKVDLRRIDGEIVSLSVQVVQATNSGAWEISLQAGEFQKSQMSDQTGRVIFPKVNLASLDSLEISYRPVSPAESATS